MHSDDAPSAIGVTCSPGVKASPVLTLLPIVLMATLSSRETVPSQTKHLQTTGWNTYLFSRSSVNASHAGSPLHSVLLLHWGHQSQPSALLVIQAGTSIRLLQHASAPPEGFGVICSDH